MAASVGSGLELTVTPREPPSVPDVTPRRGRPVISVGNLAMGGRGKTPVVAQIARWLVEAGERPAILSRGYKRRRPEDGVVIVSDGVRMRADIDRSGDEPLMLARQVPGAAVLVCDVRTLAAAVAERVLGATVHILDDGFQHTAMPRDLDVVLVAPADLTDRRLPFGRLRSPVRSLARADAVIVDGFAPDDVIAAIRTHAPPDRTALFALTRQLGTPVWIDAVASENAAGVARSEPVVAVAGIASPERFVRALEGAGYRVARTVAFRDHHVYRRRDIDAIAVAVRESRAQAVLTTEKDAVRLLPLRPLPIPVAAVPLEISIEPGTRFREWLMAKWAEVRR